MAELYPTPERIRACLDAVLQQKQQADQYTSHVMLPLAVADDIARVLQLAKEARAGSMAAGLAESGEAPDHHPKDAPRG